MAFLIGYIGDVTGPQTYQYKDEIVVVYDKYQCPTYCAINHNHYVHYDKNITKNTRNTMQNISVFKKEESFIVPNLIGKSLRSALEDANLAGIELVPIGLGGKIVWQSLKPGSIINNKSQCKVKLSI